MEEILASIRRIIADDTPEAANAVQPDPAQQAASSRPVPVAVEPESAEAMSQDDIDAMLADQAADDGDDVLELTERVAPEPADLTPPPGFRQVPASDVMFRDEQGAQELTPQALQQQMPGTADQLLSPSTTAAVSAAFGSLATTILAENARTLEDLVKEMMKPMLKAWLDDNLPGLVERMVRAEIERVARGGK